MVKDVVTKNVNKLVGTFMDQVPDSVKDTALLRLFGLTKIPLLWFIRPSVQKMDDEMCVIKVHLNRRTKNHLNSMYFGIHANDVFGKIGIQSPAPHPCPDIYNDYADTEKLPIDIFLSTGTVKDKKKATRKLKKILEEKGYEFEYKEVPE